MEIKKKKEITNQYKSNNKEFVTIKLFINNEIAHSLQFPTHNATTQSLTTHMKTLLNSPLIVGFQSIEPNIPLDYYLTLNKDLGILANQTLSLKPLHAVFQNQISLDSFHFL